MSRIAEAAYKGCNIFTVAVPAGHGKWSAVADIERSGPDGVETFQDVTNASLADTEDGARLAARIEAVRRIDEMIAETKT